MEIKRKIMIIKLKTLISLIGLSLGLILIALFGAFHIVSVTEEPVLICDEEGCIIDTDNKIINTTNWNVNNTSKRILSNQCIALLYNMSELCQKG